MVPSSRELCPRTTASAMARATATPAMRSAKRGTPPPSTYPTPNAMPIVRNGWLRAWSATSSTAAFASSLGSKSLPSSLDSCSSLSSSSIAMGEASFCGSEPTHHAAEQEPDADGDAHGRERPLHDELGEVLPEVLEAIEQGLVLGALHRSAFALALDLERLLCCAGALARHRYS